MIHRRSVRRSIPVSLVSIHALQVDSLAGRDDFVCFFAVTDRVGVQVIGIDLSDAFGAVHCCSVRSVCENGDDA